MIWLTTGALMVLLFAPASGWLVRSQFQRLVSPFPWLVAFMKDLGIKETIGYVTGDPDFPDRLRNAANRLPDDGPAQIACAVCAQNRAEALRALVPRFPDDPSLRASILRFATQSEIRLNRPDILVMRLFEEEFAPALDRLAG